MIRRIKIYFSQISFYFFNYYLHKMTYFKLFLTEIYFHYNFRHNIAENTLTLNHF